jgi:divalent metal cation (Fe/Co/Zn/Cd) transporter
MACSCHSSPPAIAAITQELVSFLCAAITANGLIFCAKMSAWLACGGSALLAEAIHSIADVGNQAMLRFGIVKAARKPSREFPYGHLRDKFIFRCVSINQFFWPPCALQECVCATA